MFNFNKISKFLRARTFSTTSISSKAHENDTILTERFKGVTIFTLNRPEKQNAFNRLMLNELAHRLHSFEADDESSVAVINGSGGNFSAGYDIEELRQNEALDKTDLCKNLIIPFRRATTKPIICSISGVCHSIGFELALMCDIRYVEDKTILGFANRQLGIPLLNDGPKRLAKLIGVSKALEVTLMERNITAHEAVEMGIANLAVQDGTAHGRAMKTAVHLSSMPQSALQYDLNNLYEIVSNDFAAKLWPQIIADAKATIMLDQQSRKDERISKLNSMPAWELDEIEREKEYAKRTKQSDGLE